MFTAQKSLSLWSFVTQAVFSGTPGVGSRGPGDTGEAGGPTRSLTQGARETRLPTSGLARGPHGGPGSEEKDTADGVTGPPRDDKAAVSRTPPP